MRISEKDTNVGLGLPSVVLILVVVAVNVFALLGLRSAQAEKKLAEKTGESVKNCFALESLAEERIAEADELLAGAGDSKTKVRKLYALRDVTGAEYRRNDKGQAVYDVKMYVRAENDETTAVAVRVEFAADGSFDIKEWRMVKEEPENGYELMIPD